MVATFTGGDFYFCPIPPIWGIMTFLGVIMPGKRENYISWDEYFMGIAILRSDDELPWAREGDWIDTKYPYVCHAELNAILNSSITSLKGSTLYVALFPCNECAKAIIQTGIKKVIYLSDKYRDTDATKASRMMLTAAGVELVQLRTGKKELILHFNE